METIKRNIALPIGVSLSKEIDNIKGLLEQARTISSDLVSVYEARLAEYENAFYVILSTPWID